MIEQYQVLDWHPARSNPINFLQSADPPSLVDHLGRVVLIAWIHPDYWVKFGDDPPTYGGGCTSTCYLLNINEVGLAIREKLNDPEIRNGARTPRRLSREGQRILDRIVLLHQDQIEMLIAQIEQVLDNVKFKEWMKAVDVCLAQKVPLATPYREWFDSGMFPAQAAHKALQDERLFDEEDEFDR